MQTPELACHLSPVKWAPIDEKVKARRDAQKGIDQAVAAAERKVSGWSAVALEFIRLYCLQRKGERCTGHDIVKASKAKGVIQPENAKAWGGPIQRAAREGLIRRVGYTDDPNRHGNPIPLWEVIG